MSEIVICPHCKAENPASAYSCQNCRRPLPAGEAVQAPAALEQTAAQTVICPRCKKENPASTHICPKCGRLLPAGEAAEERARLEAAARPTHLTIHRPTSVGGIIVAVVALLVWAYTIGDLITTYSDLSDYRELSAIQVTQLYTQSSFWLLAVIGLLLIGLLFVVATRG